MLRPPSGLRHSPCLGGAPREAHCVQVSLPKGGSMAWTPLSTLLFRTLKFDISPSLILPLPLLGSLCLPASLSPNPSRVPPTCLECKLQATVLLIAVSPGPEHLARGSPPELCYSGLHASLSSLSPSPYFPGQELLTSLQKSPQLCLPHQSTLCLRFSFLCLFFPLCFKQKNPEPKRMFIEFVQ